MPILKPSIPSNIIHFTTGTVNIEIRKCVIIANDSTLRKRRMTHTFIQYSLTLTSAIKNDVISLKEINISDYVEGIFQIELQTKDTTDPVQSISYLSLNLEIGNEDWVKLKRLKFSFRIYRKITDVITGWLPVIISVSQMTTNIFQ